MSLRVVKELVKALLKVWGAGLVPDSDSVSLYRPQLL